MLNSGFILIKGILSLAIALSAVAGFVFYAHAFPPELAACAAGVFLLSAGAAALNQYQEREADRLMERTRQRPVPSGAIRPVTALAAALVLAISGTLVLWIFSGPVPALLGALNLAWYNGVYTPLKRSSGFAVLAGALNGAVPPLIGWTAAGGSIADPEILFLAFFIYLWQVPHFGLLLMMHEEDYRKAGFQTFSARIPQSLQPYVLLVWITATVISSLFLPLFGILHSRLISLLVTGCSVVLLGAMTAVLLKTAPGAGYRRPFLLFNIFMAAIFLLVIADQLIARSG